MRISENDYEANEFCHSHEDQWDGDEETEDENEDCDGCKWWSELCAMSLGCGPMDALCLNPDSACYSKMIHGGCEQYKRGRSIDDLTPS